MKKKNYGIGIHSYKIRIVCWIVFFFAVFVQLLIDYSHSEVLDPSAFDPKENNISEQRREKRRNNNIDAGNGLQQVNS